MSAAIRDRAPVPLESLTSGSVKGWHVALLFVLVWSSMAVVSVKYARDSAAEWRSNIGTFLLQALTAALVVLITLAVPELRKSMRSLYVRYREALRPSDVVLFLLVMVAWVFGLSRIASVYPVVAWWPNLAPAMGIYGHAVSWDSTSIFLTLVASAVVAPFAEELVFRGYLLNLWWRRWGLPAGIVLSSLLFGLLHVQFAIMAVGSGVLFSLAYVRFGSLWPVTLLHALCNLVALGLNNPLFIEKRQSEIASLAAWVPELVLSALFFPLLWLFWRRFRPGT